MASPFKRIKFDIQPGKVALITGGSSGIGLSIAKLLASMGMDVWLVARRKEHLEKASEEIYLSCNDPNQKCNIVSADVSDWDQALDVADRIEEAGGVPDLVINSAGVTHPGYVQDLDIDIFRWMMNVNYFGTVNMSRAVMGGMISRGWGYIVNISSITGFVGVYGYTAYGASKYAVRGYSDTLRAELKPMGIGMSIVFPSDTDTPQLAYENKIKPPETKYLNSLANIRTPEKVAQAVVKGISRGDYLIFPSFDDKLIFKLSNIFGAGVYTIMDYLVYRAQRNMSR